MPGSARHRPWTAEESEQLRAYIERGGSAATAAIRFRRTEGAVRTHARTLGLRFPTIRQRRERLNGRDVTLRE